MLQTIPTRIMRASTCGLRCHFRPLTLPALLLPAMLFHLMVFHLAALSAQAQDAMAQDAVNVQGEGLATIYPADLARTQAEALEAAFRDAVEKASGIIVESETSTRNFELVRDEVLTRSKGYIRDYQITGKGEERGVYVTRISAQVVRASFMREMEEALETLYRRVGKPRILVAIVEQKLDQQGQPEKAQGGALKGVAEKEMRKPLIKRGFTVIGVPHNNTLDQAAGGDDKALDTLLRSAKNSRADLLVLGRATVQAVGKQSNFNIANTDLALDVIRVDSGQVIASEVQSARGLHVSQSTAEVNAVQKAAENILPGLMEQVTYVWLKDKSEGTRLEVQVKEASFAQLVALTHAMASPVTGLKGVRQQSYQDTTGVIELTTRKTAPEVAEALTKLEIPQARLTVERVTRNLVTVRLQTP